MKPIASAGAVIIAALFIAGGGVAAQPRSHVYPTNDNERFLKTFVEHLRRFEVPLVVETQPDCHYALVLSNVGDVSSLTFTNCPNPVVRSAVLQILAAAMPMPVPPNPERVVTGSFHATQSGAL